MSNIVSFRVQIEGSDSIKTVTFSADELGKAFNAVRESSDGVRESIVKWSLAGQAAERKTPPERGLRPQGVRPA